MDRILLRVFKTGTYHFPTVIGHEFSGVVSDIGSSTYLSWLGKRVSVFPLKPCFKCNNCKNKEYELCSNYDYLGSRCNGGLRNMLLFLFGISWRFRIAFVMKKRLC